MQKYFILKDKDQKGPFSLDELKKLQITSDYLIWSDNFDYWKSVLDVEELKNYVIILPPPTPIYKKEVVKKERRNKSFKIGLISFVIIFLFMFFINYGFESDFVIEHEYNTGENPIYGNGNDIRKFIISFSFVISLVFSLIISFFIYYRKSKHD